MTQMVRTGSLIKDYAFYVSCDPAFAPPPAVPGDDSSDEVIAEFRAAAKEYVAKWKTARETTDYGPLLVEGKTPVKFMLGHVKSKIWRAVHDRGTLPSSSPRYLGNSSVLALMTRLALRAIPSSDVNLTHSPDLEWNGWEMAPEGVIDLLDSQNPSIVGEIGNEVLRRLQQGVPQGSGPLFSKG